MVEHQSAKIFYSIIYIILISVLLSASVCWGISSTTLLLNDGNRIPRISFGTLGRVSDHYMIKPAVIQAIEAGFRQIDTAASYENEVYIGEAIAEVIERGIVTREELWVTTKLNFTNGNRDRVIPELRTSLKRLQLDYVDLYLIHAADNVFDVPDFNYLSTWRGMEDAKKMNLTRSIGVSNFASSDLNRILAHSETVPSVNEIEASVTYTNLDTVAYCQSQNIAVLAYAPFGFLVPKPFLDNTPIVTFEEPILLKVAEKYCKSPSQVVLRYLIDRGIIPIPRSTNVSHINMNIDIFDFNLTQEEIYLINELDQNVKVYIISREEFIKTGEYFYS